MPLFTQLLTPTHYFSVFFIIPAREYSQTLFHYLQRHPESLYILHRFSSFVSEFVYSLPTVILIPKFSPPAQSMSWLSFVYGSDSLHLIHNHVYIFTGVLIPASPA